MIEWKGILNEDYIYNDSISISRYENTYINKYSKDLYSDTFATSSLDNVIIFSSFSKETEETNSAAKKTTTSTLDIPSSLLKEDSKLLQREKRIKEKKYKQQVLEQEKRLFTVLVDFSIENDVAHESEKIILDIAEQYSMQFLGEVLQSLSLKYHDRPNVVAGICFGLERFDAKEVYPWGQSIILTLINHPSNYVKERVVSLIDNFEDVSLLPSLRSMEISTDWMNEYVQETIKYLEDKQCIM